MNKEMPEQNKYGYLGLANGAKLMLNNPDPHVMDITTIAAALSKLCRFSGQVNDFFSVAQHSVNVSHLVSEEHAFTGLMHDAAEAFCADMPKPIKQMIQGYDEIEERMWEALCTRYHLPENLPLEVHEADRVAVMWEAKTLMPYSNWYDWYPHLVDSIPKGDVIPIDHKAALIQFMNRYEELTV
jgi:hypothetical protein